MKSYVLGALIVAAGFCVQAQDIPSVSNVAGMVSEVDLVWTNHPTTKTFPLGIEMEFEIGTIAFESTFETNFISTLTAVTNDSVVLYPIRVVETNQSGRVRIYYNADETAVHTSEVDAVDYPNGWIEAAYGPPPVYLSGTALADWYADRDPAQHRVSFDLLSTSQVAAYTALMTNAVATQTSTQSWANVLALYSNDIAAVAVFGAQGAVDLYLHAPTNVAMLDVWRTGELSDTNEWSLRATLTHGMDPVHFDEATGLPLATYAASDATADPDGDQLASGREFFFYGTSMSTNDTDGDGLNDFQELMVHGTDALNEDSDSDGLLDGEEVLVHQLNPTSNDTDGDWVTDGYELAHGSSPTDPDDHAVLAMRVNGDTLYVADTNLTLSIPGLAADSLQFTEESSSGQVHIKEVALSEAMPYALAFTNGAWRTLAAVPRRNPGPEEGRTVVGTLFSGHDSSDFRGHFTD